MHFKNSRDIIIVGILSVILIVFIINLIDDHALVSPKHDTFPINPIEMKNESKKNITSSSGSEIQVSTDQNKELVTGKITDPSGMWSISLPESKQRTHIKDGEWCYMLKSNDPVQSVSSPKYKVNSILFCVYEKPSTLTLQNLNKQIASELITRNNPYISALSYTEGDIKPLIINGYGAQKYTKVATMNNYGTTILIDVVNYLIEITDIGNDFQEDGVYMKIVSSITKK